MPDICWYWNRLKKMSPEERIERFRQFCHRWKDWWTLPDFRLHVSSMEPKEGAYPIIPAANAVPETLKNAIGFDSDRIMSGSWPVFKQIVLKVDRHPYWQKDYLRGVDVSVLKSSTHLNHRRLPGEADVKMIWELSRWTHLVRLSMEGYLFNDRWTMKVALRRIYHWTKKNFPLTGYNWTSALEAGIRLINYCWIDALTLAGAANKRLGDESTVLETSLNRLRKAVLPAHVWFVWRYKSFGSSANNHLLGELAGLICALSRWPQLEYWAAPLDRIQQLWEEEILKQFAEDGGNREQALNYHLFSFELCWQSYLALASVGRKVSPEVYERLQKAVDFFVIVQSRKDPWDYGDSDDAFVTPFWERENEIAQEWIHWMETPENETGIKYWLGEPPPLISEKPACQNLENGWFYFPDTGIASFWQGMWMGRWDLSPLGYLQPAAHGHLDALHFSLWYRELAFIIDPGTGAYYGDLRARNYLASWKAHNGPHLKKSIYPERQGPFLWSEKHEKPVFSTEDNLTLKGELSISHGIAKRRIIMIPSENAWCVEDCFLVENEEVNDELEVCWQFAPECMVERVDEHSFRISRQEGASLLIRVDEKWQEIELYIPEDNQVFNNSTEDLRGLCSPGFRSLQRSARLILTGSIGESYQTNIKGE